MLASNGNLTVSAGSTSAIVTAHGLNVKPQVVVFFAYGGGATGQRNGTQEFCFGAMDGTNQFGSGSTVPDAQTNGDLVAMVNNTSEVLLEVEATGNTVTGRVAMTSLDSTNFTITPTDAFASQRFVTWIALAGITNAFVDAFMMAAAGGSFSRTAPNFRPDGALIVMPNTATTMNNVGQRAHYSVGATAGGNQWCAMWAREEATSNYTIGSVLTDAVAAHSVNATSFIERIQFTSFDATGYTMNRINGSAARPLCVICFQGGRPIVGTITARTGSTGTISVPTVGQTSKFLFLSARPPATAADAAPVEPGEVAYGIATGTSQRQTWWKFEHNAEVVGGGSPTDAISNHDSNLIWRTFTRTATDTIAQAQSMDIQSIQTDSVTLNQTVVDANATLIGYLSMGDPFYPGIQFPRPSRGSAFDDITRLMKRPLDFVPAVNLDMSPFAVRAIANAGQAKPVNLARLGSMYATAHPGPNPADTVFKFPAPATTFDSTGAGSVAPVTPPGASGWPDRRRRFIGGSGGPGG